MAATYSLISGLVLVRDIRGLLNCHNLTELMIILFRVIHTSYNRQQAIEANKDILNMSELTRA